MSVLLDYSLEMMLLVVKRKTRSEFEVRWRTVAEMNSYTNLLTSNRKFGKYLHGLLAVTDVERMLCADFIDPELQNAYFEGFTQNIEVTNLFAWNVHGELIHAAINFPGTWHDSKLV